MEEDIKRIEKFISDIKECGKNCFDFNLLRNLLTRYKQLEEENTQLKTITQEYIAIVPNLDEMTATKYRNIQQDAYIQGRAEEQQKVEQIIYENYIPIQKVKDKIEYLDNQQKQWIEDRELKESDSEIIFARDILKELLEKEK